MLPVSLSRFVIYDAVLTGRLRFTRLSSSLETSCPISSRAQAEWFCSTSSSSSTPVGQFYIVIVEYVGLSFFIFGTVLHRYRRVRWFILLHAQRAAEQVRGLHALMPWIRFCGCVCVSRHPKTVGWLRPEVMGQMMSVRGASQ